MSLTVQLKITLGDTTRQISVLKSTNLLDLQSTVAALFALPPRTAVKFAYIDDENDRISIGSTQELADAFAHTNALHLHAAENGFFAPTEIDENGSDDDSANEADSESEISEEDSPLVQFFRDLGARLQGEGASVTAQIKKAVDELLQSGVVARSQLAQAYAALAASPKEMQELVSRMIVILREQHATIAALGADDAAAASLSRARHAALCDRCRQTIVGVRYKCSACADFDLCAACFRLNVVDHQHPESHLFLTIVAPLRGSPAVFYQRQPPVPPPMPMPVPVRRFVAPPPPPPAAVAVPRGPLFARLVSDETIPEGTKVKPGEQFTKIWRIENTGNVAWPAGCHVVAVGGQTLSDFEASEPLPAVQVGHSISVAVDMRAPQEAGEYTSFWRLAEHDDTRFGARLWVTIQVEQEEPEVVEPEREVEEKEPEPPVSEAPIGDSILNVIERSFEHIEQVVSQIVDPPAPVVEEPAAEAAIDDSLWRSQRSQLKAMGFGQNEEQLQQLLQKHNGEVLKVVQELLEDL